MLPGNRERVERVRGFSIRREWRVFDDGMDDGSRETRVRVGDLGVSNGEGERRWIG